ncbi:MAG: tetratricopeptide repeat protein [Planctomycetota bacterium]|nr:tetratricopeptide repeat protein [Planctomycetota bacterium]
MKAKRKQELKHDQFVDNVVAWFVKSQKQLTPYKYHLLGGVGVLLVIFIGIAGMQAAEQSKTSQAWSELEAEKKKAADGEDADFGRLAALYKGSQTEPWILYYWSEYSFGKLAEAKTDKDKDTARAKGITALEKLKDGFPRHPIAKRSGIVLAQQYADQQNWDKAISAYRAVLTSESEYVGKYLKDKAQFGLAYALEGQGNINEAITNYEKLDSGDQSHWGDMAKFRLERLRAAGYRD